jgi:hypothetical protein
MIQKGTPGTRTEQWVADLCDRAFLGLWSYPRVYFNKGVKQRAQGKEVSDLLVVFDNHIILFEDKDCAFPDTGNEDVDWQRWYKGSILRAATQLRRGERWIRSGPDRLFLDPACSEPFPVKLPTLPDAVFHLVAVVHGSARRSQRALKSRGGLVVTNTLTGFDLEQRPFTAGDLDPRKTFVHIFDDLSLRRVLSSVDTVTDFIRYMDAKEELLRSDVPVLARSEEDLLASYLPGTERSQHACFAGDVTDEGVTFDAGSWDRLESSSWWKRRRELNELSYAWDSMIQDSASNTLKGQRWFSYPDDSFSDSETILRFMARESRERRRTLGRFWLEALAKSHPDRRYLAFLSTNDPHDTHWAFLFLPRENDDYAAYRDRRKEAIENACRLLRYRFPNARDIVAIAGESGLVHRDRTEDLMYFDARFWCEHDEAAGAALNASHGNAVSNHLVPATYNESEPLFLDVLLNAVRDEPPC